MIYVMMSYKVAEDKVKEYEAIHEKEALPVLRKHGVKIIGIWKYYIGGETGLFVRINAFDSLADFEEKDARVSSDPDYKKYFEKIQPMMLYHDRKVLKPAEYSPLK